MRQNRNDHDSTPRNARENTTACFSLPSPRSCKGFPNPPYRRQKHTSTARSRIASRGNTSTSPPKAPHVRQISRDGVRELGSALNARRGTTPQKGDLAQMQKVKLSLDEHTVQTGLELARRYGHAASLSSVVRRAVSLLADEWQRINEEPEATTAERAAMIDFLSRATRGNAVR